MPNWCENRLEIVFVNIEAESEWKVKYVSDEHGKQWLDTTLKSADDDSDHQQSFAKITDEDRGDNDSLILYCDSRWALSCFFSEMVKSNPAITSASLEYGEPNLCFVGSMEWDKSTNTISEIYRCEEDLTDDDWFLLGHDRCSDCSQFLCQCG